MSNLNSKQTSEIRDENQHGPSLLTLVLRQFKKLKIKIFRVAHRYHPPFVPSNFTKVLTGKPHVKK